MSIPLKINYSPAVLEQLVALEAASQVAPRTRTSGAHCYFNPNCLNGLFWFLKEHCMGPEERRNLNDFQLQVFLVELAQTKRRYSNFERTVEAILAHLGESSRFWNEASPQRAVLERYEAVDRCGLDREAVEVCRQTLDALLDAAFGRRPSADPLVLYKRHVDDQRQRLPALTAALHPQEGLSEIEAFCFADKSRAEDPAVVDSLVRLIGERPRQVHVNGLAVPDRRVTRRTQQAFDPRALSLYEEYLRTPREVERRLALDLGAFEKLNYARSPCLNARRYHTPRLSLHILRAAFLFVKDRAPGASAAEVFDFRLQNFIMFLGVDKQPVGESYLGKKFDPLEFYELHFRASRLDGTRVLGEFLKSGQELGLDLNCLKDNPANPEKLIFLRNLLLLATLFAGRLSPAARPRRQAAEAALGRWLAADPGFARARENLEKQASLPLKTQRAIVADYILHNEQIDATHQRLKSFLSAGRSNADPGHLAAVAAYREYCEDERTKSQQGYRFFEDNRFAWTEEDFRRFLVGLKLHKDMVINNRRISQFMGPTAQPNHVKNIKGQYTRFYSKKVKQERITWERLLDLHLEEFSMDIFGFLKLPQPLKKVKQQ